MKTISPLRALLDDVVAIGKFAYFLDEAKTPVQVSPAAELIMLPVIFGKLSPTRWLVFQDIFSKFQGVDFPYISAT